jgi:hypothetical protein
MSALIMIWDAKGEPFEVPEKKAKSLLSAGFTATPPAFHTGGFVTTPDTDIPAVLKPSLINPKKRRSAKVTTDE